MSRKNNKDICNKEYYLSRRVDFWNNVCVFVYVCECVCVFECVCVLMYVCVCVCEREREKENIRSVFKKLFYQKLYLMTRKWTSNETLIFLVFNKFNPIEFPTGQSTFETHFIYMVSYFYWNPLRHQIFTLEMNFLFGKQEKVTLS